MIFFVYTNVLFKHIDTVHGTHYAPIAPITLRPRIPRIAKNWQFSGFVVESLSVREVPTSFVYIRSEYDSTTNPENCQFLEIRGIRGRSVIGVLEHSQPKLFV